MVVGVARRGLGIGLGALAREAGVSSSYLSQIERGITGPSPRVVVRLMAGIGVIGAMRLAAARLAAREAREGAPDA